MIFLGGGGGVGEGVRTLVWIRACEKIHKFTLIYFAYLELCNMNQNSQKLNNSRAVTCDFQQSDNLTSVDSDESVQPHFKLRNCK